MKVSQSQDSCLFFKWSPKFFSQVSNLFVWLFPSFDGPLIFCSGFQSSRISYLFYSSMVTPKFSIGFPIRPLHYVFFFFFFFFFFGLSKVGSQIVSSKTLTAQRRVKNTDKNLQTATYTYDIIYFLILKKKKSATRFVTLPQIKHQVLIISTIRRRWCSRVKAVKNKVTKLASETNTRIPKDYHT